MSNSAMGPGRIAAGGLVLMAVLLCPIPPAVAEETAIARGERIFHAGGCFSCHTDTKAGIEPLAGGPPLETPFGTFYGPNITPDPQHGIGNWSETDFLRALKEGRGPDGRHYYPSFPYTSFAKAKDSDLRDLWSYVISLPPVDRASRPHDLPFPFSWRATLIVWKWLNFDDARNSLPTRRRSDAWNQRRVSGRVAVALRASATPVATGSADSTTRCIWRAPRTAPTATAFPTLPPIKDTGIGGWSESDIAFHAQGRVPAGR